MTAAGKELIKHLGVSDDSRKLEKAEKMKKEILEKNERLQEKCQQQTNELNNAINLLISTGMSKEEALEKIRAHSE